MRKLILVLLLMLGTANISLAAKIPENVKSFVTNSFPQTKYRFDGLIMLPDSTVYLPLFPSNFYDDNELTIKYTIPANKKLSDKPEAVVFNNNFVLLKMIKTKDGKNTVLSINQPPYELRSGLLPQDLLVPKGFVVPENLKGITGNLVIGTSNDLKVEIMKPKNTTQSTAGVLVPELKNKTFYVSSPYSKNIQVLTQGKKTPDYALEQENTPISIAAYNNEFLLVTSFDKKTLDVISLADDAVIRQIVFPTQPDEIIIDNSKKLAYVSSGEAASIFIVNLDTMTLSKQIKLNGMCEKMFLSEDGTKLLYNDKKTREIWAIELDNKYLLKDIGRFPNVSKIVYAGNKVYITSRTKNHLAIIDYDSINLITELEVCSKPIDMLPYKDKVFLLSAGDNAIQIIDIATDKIVDQIDLQTDGFSTKIHRIDNTNSAIVTDSKSSIYSIINLDTNDIVATNPLDIPVGSITVSDKVKKMK